MGAERLSRTQVLRTYPHWFYLPAVFVFGVFFLVPTAMAFYFSLTRWTLFNANFIGSFRTTSISWATNSS